MMWVWGGARAVSRTADQLPQVNDPGPQPAELGRDPGDLEELADENADSKRLTDLVPHSGQVSSSISEERKTSSSNL